MAELKSIEITKPDDVNIIIGQAHFIKTVEDIYEVLVQINPQMKFGVAFSESSGSCLIRLEGNDEELKKIAKDNSLSLGAGHSFIIAMRNGYPISVLNAVKLIPEVCSIYCATANYVEVIVAEGKKGRGILGVIDGEGPKGIEKDSDVNWRKELLRKIGYKR